ncbi:gliding motility-associated C-terminal domain-containing protein [Cecembia rubra]|nr:gliding motility-associated C-terminal domain-containing protein [Cecembia rubra]
MGMIIMLIYWQQAFALSAPKSFWGYFPSSHSLDWIDQAQPSEQLSVKVSGKLALCHHLDRGHIILEVSGGVPPYSFLWNNQERTQNRHNLFAGTYTVFITDSQGRRHEERIVIQPPFPLIVEMAEIQAASCSGIADGSASVKIRFGRGEPYKILWSHGLENELDAKNLMPGTYSVKVIDMFNCDVTLSFEIKSNAASFEVKENIKQISCADNSKGEISLEITGGKAPYTFSWSNGMTTKDIAGLEAGKYDVMIKDQAGCTINRTFEIKSPSTVEVMVTRIQHNLCHGLADGEIDVEVKGGQPPLLFNWNNGSTTKNLKGLKAGTYTLKVKDASGCEINTQVIVQEPQKLTAKLHSSVDMNCESGEATGFAWVQIQGGVAPYKIKWGTGETGRNEIEFKRPGEIQVEVIDNSGCSVVEKIRVDFPFDNNSIAARIDFNVRKLSFSSEPEVQVLEPLVFESEIGEDFIAWEWDFGDGSTTTDKDPVHVFKSPGEFDVILRGFDIYGCSSLQSRVIKVLESDEWVTIPNAFTPNGDGLNDVFRPVMKGVVNFEIDIFNHWGEHIFASSGLENSGWDGTNKGRLLPRGNYIYKVKYSTISGETVQKTGTVTLIR